MAKPSIHRSASRKRYSSSRRPRIERYEDRRMLTTMADIVFLVDESGSGDTSIENWLAGMIDDLDATLSANMISARYGLVGFGLTATGSFGHSFFVNPNTGLSNNERLFGTAVHMTTAFTNLNQAGGDEDGWDAIDHAIAEYDFRPNAVPVVVLVQNEELRVKLNTALTRDAMLTALASRNVLLNSLVVGPNIVPSDSNSLMEPLFDLAPYGLSNQIRVLGVEADAADAVFDGLHNYHAFNTVTNTIPASLPETQADTLQISFDGSNTGESGMVGSRKSILVAKNITGGIGPATSGYRAKSVPYSFVDLATDPLRQQVTDPMGATLLSAAQLGSFTFQFFGTRSSLRINRGGLITFNEEDSSGSNLDWSQEPAPSNQPSIAVLWDNWVVNPTNGNIFWKVEGTAGSSHHRLIIQWDNFASGGFNPQDPVTFQAILYADGRIYFNYRDLDSYTSDLSQSVATATGAIGATVGLWKGSADPVVLPAGKFVPGPHSINGSYLLFDTSGDGSGASDSYVRLAWDTGGAAWDFGVLEEFIGSGGINSPEANALRDAFRQSLAGQIAQQAASGRLAGNDNVLLALNIGGPQINAGTAGIFRADNGTFTADGGTATVEDFGVPDTQPIDTASNSIPVGTDIARIFRTARGEETDVAPSENLQITIDALDNGSGGQAAFPTGMYIVELFFAELSESFPFRQFDVRLEGKTILNEYEIASDATRIVAGFNSTQLGISSADNFTGTVKRYEIEVGDADGQAGLQIELIRSASADHDPILNGVRILRADPPRVENVVLKGTTWADGVDYSYAEAVTAGKQLAPMYRQNANRIEVHFDRAVSLIGNELTLLSTVDQIVPTSYLGYDALNHIATWSVTGGLSPGKFALLLNGATITSGPGNDLDGEWTNQTGPNPLPAPSPKTYDHFMDDPARAFVVGNGVDGGDFRFHFSALPGDYNQDGFLSTADTAVGVVKDGDGDGIIESGPSGQDTVIASSATVREISLRARNGDYYVDANQLNDDRVDNSDYMAWKAAYGDTLAGEADGYLEEDGNGNGIVDTADYNIWRDQLGAYSAWVEGSSGSGSGASIPLVLPGPPTVLNVVVSGSNSVHAPYSFDTVDGSGEQLRTVPVGGADTVKIVFNEDVNIQADHVMVVGMGTANRPAVAEFLYDIGTMTATWRFEQPLAYDHYAIQLSDAVTDVEGIALDGDWTNPRTLSTVHVNVSEFPSGDGTAGGDFGFVITILPGDRNTDNRVLHPDEEFEYESWTEWSLGNFNGDAVVDQSDMDLLEANLGIDLRSLNLLADLNGDWKVNEADMDIIYGNDDLANPTQAQGDLDGDGDIDLDDVDLAFAQYGLEISVVG